MCSSGHWRDHVGSWSPGPCCRDEAGATVVEAAIVVPVAMMVVLVAVQACLWAHAGSLVQTAAAEGDQAACNLGGSTSAGVERATQFLASAASGSVTNTSVNATMPAAGTVEIRVEGTAESVLPWLHLTVTATRRGEVQDFRPSE